MTNNKLTFGKYKNKTIDWLYNNDKAYLDWLVKQDFFKKFNYFKTFRDYKPDPIHIKYCFENNIRFCSWCCKKQRIKNVFEEIEPKAALICMKPTMSGLRKKIMIIKLKLKRNKLKYMKLI